ncbi:MAG: methyltransferase domain-containing protein [Clostridium tyrobutyricum]|uniref:class I SAM-dependent methyltransferase n=1 Tax=Clostridium tyrobutyricum TaxID=1519 RepID=UPI00242CB2BA|nr:class I SAM-dependent methyltransferase [Clostridium tyrobutyricum]MCH4201175.1 methyltransferase domain-containing protein [Clostridium tyrobutyricum]MCH4238444.1 methyltransferase domain-containing protein [Clostridium tyrobutyricum]MCH4260350.1 methyltransferase domain-containing protein [Clostridium tyrobutyricum]
MNNPWKEINLKIYEEHMSSEDVYQLQTLNEITKEQLNDNPHMYVGIFGVAGGNGLDNVDILNTKKVYAIDINKSYLDICKERYKNMGNTLEIVCKDLTDDDFKLPYSNLIICNLIIEYIGEKKFVSIINKNKININIVSCVIQKNNDNSFVSNSKLTSYFEPILSIHHDISENKLKKLFSDIQFNCIKYKEYMLPNGKKFIRMDFKRL